MRTAPTKHDSTNPHDPKAPTTTAMRRDWLRIGLALTAIFITIGVLLAVAIAPVISTWRDCDEAVPLSDLIAMRFSPVDYRTIALTAARAQSAGLEDVTWKEIEHHSRAGGRPQIVVSALTSAKSAEIDLTFTTACNLDLAGRDPLDLVQRASSTDDPALDGKTPNERFDQLLKREFAQ